MIRLLSIVCFASAVLSTARAQYPHPADERGYIVRVGDAVPDFQLECTRWLHLLASVPPWDTLCAAVHRLLVWRVPKRDASPRTRSVAAFGGDQFVLLGVDLDEPAEKVAAFAEQMGTTYPIAPDPEGALFYKIAGPKSGVTRNVVVDETGTIVFLTRLFEAEEFEAMKSVIEGLVD